MDVLGLSSKLFLRGWMEFSEIFLLYHWAVFVLMWQMWHEASGFVSYGKGWQSLVFRLILAIHWLDYIWKVSSSLYCLQPLFHVANAVWWFSHVWIFSALSLADYLFSWVSSHHILSLPCPLPLSVCALLLAILFEHSSKYLYGKSLGCVSWAQIPSLCADLALDSRR